MTMQSSTGLSTTATAAVDDFAPLRVKHIVRETPDAVSLVLEVPAGCAHQFRYRAGQFLTVRLKIDGAEHRRCYSMSSSPAVGEDLRITVKRDRDGVVSNWLNDTAVAGTRLDAAPPEGRFVLGDTDRELVAFAGGSGITPVFSLIHSALAGTPRRARLFYANRDRASVIFDEALTKLVAGPCGSAGIAPPSRRAVRGRLGRRHRSVQLRGRRRRLLHLWACPVHGHRGGGGARRRGIARAHAP
jgi:3-ketosteroid 9alpha-monooxygenase subunit B